MLLPSIARSITLGVLFASGSPFLFAQAAPSVTSSPQISSGVTTLSLNPTVAGALSGVGITPSAVSPAVLDYGTGILSLPVAGGAIGVADGRGEIIHGGGLQLAAGGAVVQLTNLVIDTTGSAPVIKGVVIVNGAPLVNPADSTIGNNVLFNLQPTNLTTVPEPGFSALLSTNATVTLSSPAAAALNQALGSSVLSSGLPIGTATVFGLAINGK